MKHHTNTNELAGSVPLLTFLTTAILFGAPVSLHSQVTRLAGTASEIAVGAQGSAVIIGTWPCNDHGCTIYAHQGGSSWTALPGSAVRVAVAPSGDPWAITAKNEIYRFSNGRFEQAAGLATDIAIGADGSVFVIGTGSCNSHGCGIYKYEGTGWTKIPGAAVGIAVDPSGNPWAVTSSGEIYRWSGSTFERVEGSATDIAIGADGSVNIVGVDRCDSLGCMVYRRESGQWVARNVTAVNIAADSADDIWVTNRGNEIIRIGHSGVASVEFTALNYNVMMLSSAAFPNHQQTLRAERIPAAISRSGTYDAVVFSEAFETNAREVLRQGMADRGYSWSTGVVSESSGLRQNGGVYIQSRWPIVHTASVIYSHCGGADCLAAKGAAYARVLKHGRIFHVFGTHLQSERGEPNHSVRIQQLNQLMAFMNEHAAGAASRNEPVLILGDFNICDTQDELYYRDMLARLNAVFSNRPAGWSFDTQHNSLARYRYPDAAPEWLDYVMTSGIGLLPISTTYSLIALQSPEVYNIPAVGDPLGWFDGGTNHYDLSDHYALAAKFYFR